MERLNKRQRERERGWEIERDDGDKGGGLSDSVSLLQPSSFPLVALVPLQSLACLVVFSPQPSLLIPSHKHKHTHTQTHTYTLTVRPTCTLFLNVHVGRTTPFFAGSRWGFLASICRGLASCPASRNPGSLQHRIHSRGAEAWWAPAGHKGACAWEGRPCLICTINTLELCQWINLRKGDSLAVQD